MLKCSIMFSRLQYRSNGVYLCSNELNVLPIKLRNREHHGAGKPLIGDAMDSELAIRFTWLGCE